MLRPSYAPGGVSVRAENGVLVPHVSWPSGDRAVLTACRIVDR